MWLGTCYKFLFGILCQRYPLGGWLTVHVVHNDERALAAQLTRHPLQIRLGSRLHDQPTHLTTTTTTTTIECRTDLLTEQTHSAIRLSLLEWSSLLSLLLLLLNKFPHAKIINKYFSMLYLVINVNSYIVARYKYLINLVYTSRTYFLCFWKHS